MISPQAAKAHYKSSTTAPGTRGRATRLKGNNGKHGFSSTLYFRVLPTPSLFVSSCSQNYFVKSRFHRTACVHIRAATRLVARHATCLLPPHGLVESRLYHGPTAPFSPSLRNESAEGHQAAIHVYAQSQLSESTICICTSCAGTCTITSPCIDLSRTGLPASKPLNFTFEQFTVQRVLY